LDGKFILTDVGGSSSVEINLRSKGNSLYYAYPLSLGMPTQTYFGTIIDTDLQEIWIPVRASVHTHTGGGVSIDFPNSRSDEDLFSAEKLFNISPAFNNFVIEPYGNTYKTGRFNNDDQPNEYFDTHSGLSLADICQYIIP
jgi:hypothetical protein